MNTKRFVDTSALETPFTTKLFIDQNSISGLKIWRKILDKIDDTERREDIKGKYLLFDETLPFDVNLRDFELEYYYYYDVNGIEYQRESERNTSQLNNWLRTFYNIEMKINNKEVLETECSNNLMYFYMKNSTSFHEWAHEEKNYESNQSDFFTASDSGPAPAYPLHFYGKKQTGSNLHLSEATKRFQRRIIALKNLCNIFDKDFIIPANFRLTIKFYFYSDQLFFYGVPCTDFIVGGSSILGANQITASITNTLIPDEEDREVVIYYKQFITKPSIHPKLQSNYKVDFYTFPLFNTFNFSIPIETFINQDKQQLLFKNEFNISTYCMPDFLYFMINRGFEAYPSNNSNLYTEHIGAFTIFNYDTNLFQAKGFPAPTATYSNTIETLFEHFNLMFSMIKITMNGSILFYYNYNEHYVSLEDYLNQNIEYLNNNSINQNSFAIASPYFINLTNLPIMNNFTQSNEVAHINVQYSISTTNYLKIESITLGILGSFPISVKVGGGLKEEISINRDAQSVTKKFSKF